VQLNRLDFVAFLLAHCPETYVINANNAENKEIKMYCFEDLHTASELREKYPQVELLGWNALKIGTFLSSKLLIGTNKSSRQPALIREKSFVKLMNHSNDLRNLHNCLIDPTNRSCIDLLTPQELYEDYPRVMLLDWSAARIGMFLNAKLLIGIHKGSGRSALIARPSFVSLIELANSNLDYMKVYT